MKIHKHLFKVSLLLILAAPTTSLAQCWAGLGAEGDRIDVSVCNASNSNCVNFCVNPLMWEAVWMQDSLARIVFAIGNYGVANDPSIPSLGGIDQNKVDEVFSKGPIAKDGQTTFRGPVVVDAEYCRTCGAP